jgi:hypothetical protein
MGAAVHPASIGIMISLGTSLLAGLLSLWVAVRSSQGAAVHRDIAVSILFGIAVLLILLTGLASALLAVSGMGHVGWLKAALLLTAAFAVAGMVLGLVRGLQSGGAIKTQRA